MNRQSILPLLILALLGLSYGSHQPMHADTGYTTASAAALYYSVPNATTTPVAYPNASTGQCPNAILNGGFETDSEWWTDPGGYIDYDTRYAFSGSRSMTVNASALAAGNMVGFWQRLTLPSNASVLTLDFESMIVTGNVDTNVLVRIADAHFTTILYSQPLTYSCNCDWEHFAPALDVSAFAGRTINLSFDVNANGAIDEVNFDDVQLGVCQSGPTATPLPLPQQVAPVGEIYTDLPSYSWQAMPGAVSYLLWLNEYGSPNVSGRINEQYTPAQANCATGDLCTVSPGVRIRASLAEWWITAYFNNGNIASESLGAAFTINLNVTATPTVTPTPTDAAPSPTNTQLPPTATATPIVTPTPTATTIDVPTATVTLATPTATATLATPTATGTATATASPTTPPSATPTAGATPTAVATPTGDGDPFEEDDSCANATLLTTNGVAQVHNFHDQADADWLRFAVTANTAYLIEGDVPGDSDADLELAIYDRCGAGATSTQNYAYSPEVRLAFTATATTDYFIRLENSTLSRFGADVTYQIAVREIVPRTSKGVLIVVAGRNQEGDFLQEQIHKVTNRVYRLWRNQGYSADRIRYLATDTNLDPDRDGKADVFALPDTNNLRTAITEWAASQLTPNQSLTLYIMDHGAYDKIYLDEPRQQRLTPADLHSWLNTLEAAVPGVRITVIIEACNSGSFIDPEQSISKPGRTILTSTGAHELAWATSEGARFSDSLLDGLAMGKNLLGAFYEAQAGIVNLQLSQTPWLDDDGDRIPNDADDGLLAAQLSFDNNGLGAAIQWQPWVVSAEIRNSTAIANTQLLTQEQSQPTNARGEIWAEVRDNDKVANVWAIVYPPSYVSPTTSEELAIGPPPITLQARGNDQFAGTYGEFDEVGTYRIWVYALDDEGLHSHTKEILFQNGSRVYLPAILR